VLLPTVESAFSASEDVRVANAGVTCSTSAVSSSKPTFSFDAISAPHLNRASLTLLLTIPNDLVANFHLHTFGVRHCVGVLVGVGELRQKGPYKFHEVALLRGHIQLPFAYEFSR